MEDDNEVDNGALFLLEHLGREELQEARLSVAIDQYGKSFK